MGERADNKTLYDVLEAAATARPETIKAAFDRLITSASASDPQLQHAILDAYRTLANPETRAAYQL
jgi:DnaJ-class molecular chaperone